MITSAKSKSLYINKNSNKTYFQISIIELLRFVLKLKTYFVYFKFTICFTDINNLNRANVNNSAVKSCVGICCLCTKDKQIRVVWNIAELHNYKKSNIVQRDKQCLWNAKQSYVLHKFRDNKNTIVSANDKAICLIKYFILKLKDTIDHMLNVANFFSSSGNKSN
jgi:hypothetical protein